MTRGAGFGAGASRPRRRRQAGGSYALDLNFAASDTLDSRVTFSRASSATRFNSAGTLVTMTNDQPRFDYNPSTLAARGLLIEQARTNICPYSAELDNAAWTTSASTVTANSVASPDGTTNADTLASTATTSTHVISSASFTSTAAAYTGSIYVKKAVYRYVSVGLRSFSTISQATAVVDLNTGTITQTTASGGLSAPSSTITDVGGGWYRVTITGTFGGAYGSSLLEVGFVSGGTPTLDANGRESIALVATDTVYLWGAQLEAGAFATSYIPTVAATVTRAADSASMTGTNFSSWYNQTEGTFVTQADGFVGASTVSFIGHAVDGTGNEYIDVGRYQPNLRALVADGGILQAALEGVSTADGTTDKLAVAYKINDFALSENGGAAVTDVAATVPTPDRLWIGSDGNLGRSINGHVKRVTFYNSRKTNAELVTLSTP